MSEQLKKPDYHGEAVDRAANAEYDKMMADRNAEVQGQDDWNAYTETRLRQPDEVYGNSSHPKTGNPVDPDKYPQMVRDEHFESSTKSYEEMHETELARLLAQAELSKDSVTAKNIEDELITRFEGNDSDYLLAKTLDYKEDYKEKLTAPFSSYTGPEAESDNGEPTPEDPKADNFVISGIGKQGTESFGGKYKPGKTTEPVKVALDKDSIKVNGNGESPGKFADTKPKDSEEKLKSDNPQSGAGASEAGKSSPSSGENKPGSGEKPKKSGKKGWLRRLKEWNDKEPDGAVIFEKFDFAVSEGKAGFVRTREQKIATDLEKGEGDKKRRLAAAAAGVGVLAIGAVAHELTVQDYEPSRDKTEQTVKSVGSIDSLMPREKDADGSLATVKVVDGKPAIVYQPVLTENAKQDFDK